MTIGLVTDSNAQFPPELAAQFGVEIVPLTITVDGESFAEGTELTADAFFARYADGASPVVSTAAPSPGTFAAAYDAVGARGATEILSIHIGAAVSGTLNAARLAMELSSVPVRLVDTGTASFGVSACVWEAAEVLAAGGTADEAVAVAESVAAGVDNVFVVGGLDIVAAGGRLAAGAEAGDGIPVLSLVDGQITRIAAVSDVESATAALATVILDRSRVAGDGPIRVAVGIADIETAPLSDALRAAVADDDRVVAVTGYRIGPSVGAHTGPGTVGAYWWPAR